MSGPEVSNRFGLSVNTVMRCCKARGIPKHPNSGDLLPHDEIRRRYVGGESVGDLMSAYATTQIVVDRILAKGGIRKRSGSESMALRMSKTTPEDRQALTAAAHAAVRGKRQTLEFRCKIAAAREAKHSNVSAIESEMFDHLDGYEFSLTPQKAIGPYNVDIALDKPRIAVEIFGGHWHAGGRHAARTRQRLDYLRDRGWTVVIVWVTKGYPLKEAAAQYIVALAEIFRECPPGRGEEHVIRGDGQQSGIGQSQIDYRADVGGDNRGPLSRGKDGRFR